MSMTIQELDGFHSYARQRVQESEGNISLDELVLEWMDVPHRDDINASIRRGLEDIEAGKGRPAREFLEELRQRYSSTDS